MTTLPPILIAEDDDFDWLMIEEAFEDAHIQNDLIRFSNGVDLLSHLKDTSNRLPGLIFLDLNMPKLGGIETLTKIRSDSRIKHLVVVIMTTSKAESDILEAYCQGANTYVTKPTTFEAMTEALRKTNKYWTNVAETPILPLSMAS